MNLTVASTAWSDSHVLEGADPLLQRQGISDPGKAVPCSPLCAAVVAGRGSGTDPGPSAPGGLALSRSERRLGPACLSRCTDRTAGIATLMLLPQ